MTQLLIVFALGTVAALALAYVLLAFVVCPFHARRDAARATALITPLTVDRYRFIGHDDKLRVRSEHRRKDADRKRREAAQIASGAAKPQIYRVVNE
jgi:hypothetical protein